jgi:hypothetical protein
MFELWNYEFLPIIKIIILRKSLLQNRYWTKIPKIREKSGRNRRNFPENQKKSEKNKEKIP